MKSLFHGSALCDLDATGSFPVPEFLAGTLATAAGTGDLLLAKHDADACLIGYDRSHLQTLHERSERRRLADETAGRDPRHHHARMRRTFALVEPLRCEAGRMHVPASLRHLARIGAAALIVGTGDSFEIWNPERALESSDVAFRDLAAFRLRARQDEAPSALERL